MTSKLHKPLKMEKKMTLTNELKETIDSWNYEELLRKWREYPIGHHLFQGESGDYISKRMGELKNKTPHEEQVAASKRIGW